MNIEIRYDEEADAMYITLRKAEFGKNKKIDDLTIADLDKDGNVIGIELLSVSSRFPGLTNVSLHGLPRSQTDS